MSGQFMAQMSWSLTPPTAKTSVQQHKHRALSSAHVPIKQKHDAILTLMDMHIHYRCMQRGRRRQEWTQVASSRPNQGFPVSRGLSGNESIFRLQLFPARPTFPRLPCLPYTLPSGS